MDDEDERLTLRASGVFTAEVVPENEAEAGTWRKLDGPDDIVEFYDPTDVFGDLADTLAEAFPSLGEPLGGEDGEEDAGEAGDETEGTPADDSADSGKEGDEPR